MPDHRLRVLILEDVPTDAELMEDELRLAGIEFVSTRVEDQESFREALDRFSPEIILSDYSLPLFDGISALSIAREKTPEVPFIFVTGAVGEEGAVDLLKRGATDFILKDRLARLPLCVQRALEEVEEKRQRQQAEERIKESEKKYRELYEASRDGFVRTDLEGNIKEFNQAYTNMLGYSEEELLKLTHLNLAPEKWHSMEAEIVRGEVLTRGYSRLYEKEYVKKNGTAFPVELRIYLIKDMNGVPSGMWGFVRDVTERKRAEEDRLRLSAAVEQASESIVMADFRGVVEYANPAFEAINGYQKGEVLGKTYFDFLGSDPRGVEMRDAFSQGRQWKGHLERKRKDGEVRQLDVVVSPVKDHSGKILDYLIVERDVTQEVKTRQHIRQMQKMESLGMLAGGIAHDFNNMLMTIVINTEMALLDLDRNSPSRGALSLVLGAADRGKELVKQIITFSRQKEQDRRPMKISPILKETLKFLRSSIPSNIEIRDEIETQSDIAQADPTQIHQVLMNLCTNAAHAMREQGGILEVKLTPLVVDSKMVADHPDLKPGPCLRLTVSDTGQGMTPEVMERIFDPFFTTKKAGEGSGMGLAVVYGIVKSYGGCITVYSEVGRGSTFNVFIPHIAGEPEPARISSKILLGSERILLVEDEGVELRSFQNMLERFGYRVTARADSLEALADFEKDPQRFDLVITDQTMPKMTGVKLAEALLEVRPDIPIILCTGFSEVVDGEKARLEGVREFVMKPFSISEMSAVIRRVLGPKDS